MYHNETINLSDCLNLRVSIDRTLELVVHIIVYVGSRVPVYPFKIREEIRGHVFSSIYKYGPLSTLLGGDVVMTTFTVTNKIKSLTRNPGTEVEG